MMQFISRSLATGGNYVDQTTDIYGGARRVEVKGETVRTHTNEQSRGEKIQLQCIETLSQQ